MGKERGKYAVLIIAGFCLAILAATGCGNGNETMESETVQDTDKTGEGHSEEKNGLAHETAADGHVDFEALQQENPDIFAWLYVPGTDIDTPVLQSP
ncbi:MAG: hypothetical protein K2P19_13050, partial [Kineothrix sp.]|nr:hypothetical protein [Kineothrix sp.]